MQKPLTAKPKSRRIIRKTLEKHIHLKDFINTEYQSKQLDIKGPLLVVLGSSLLLAIIVLLSNL